MRFEQFPGRIEAGADAEVGGAFEDAAIGKVAGHRVDAVARTEIGAHVEVRGRKAQKAAVLVAVLDGPADGEGAGEEARRGRAVAGLERLADAARRDGLAALVDRGGHLDRKATRLNSSP